MYIHTYACNLFILVLLIDSQRENLSQVPVCSFLWLVLIKIQIGYVFIVGVVVGAYGAPPPPVLAMLFFLPTEMK
jgi:hypothetical protein